jgi:hypothetical protein
MIGILMLTEASVPIFSTIAVASTLPRWSIVLKCGRKLTSNSLKDDGTRIFKSNCLELRDLISMVNFFEVEDAIALPNPVIDNIMAMLNINLL